MDTPEPADAGDVLPASCKDLQTRQPAPSSGMYTIDPDGAGAEAPIEVLCDMTGAGGGWTIVFFASNVNYVTAPGTYDVDSAELLQNAQQILLTYRDSEAQITGSYAEMEIQPSWRTTTPFASAATDVTLPVTIDGGAPTMSLLRYGRHSFAKDCNDSWVMNDTYGRLCIANTRAPFFNGFANSWVDMCTDSSLPWYARACSGELRFSIAIR